MVKPKKRSGIIPGLIFAIVMVGVFLLGSIFSVKIFMKLISGDKDQTLYTYFGQYPQTLVAGTDLTDAIISAEYDENGISEVDGVRYQRVARNDAENTSYDWGEDEYHYFKFEDILWRVLENDDKTALLISEDILDSCFMATEAVDTTWESSIARSYLNGYDDFSGENKSFISKAFSERQQRALLKRTATGGTAEDFITLLSITDAENPEFSFTALGGDVNIRRTARNTTFACAMGAPSFNGTDAEGNPAINGHWTLTDMGNNAGYFAYVSDDGTVTSEGADCVSKKAGIRPVIYVDLNLLEKYQ